MSSSSSSDNKIITKSKSVPKSKSKKALPIPSDLDARSLLPDPDDKNAIVSNDPVTMQFLIERANNEKRYLEEAKLECLALL